MVNVFGLGLETLAKCADLAIPPRALADSTVPIVSGRAERGAYVSAEQLQANKNPGARAVAKILEYSIKRQQKLMEI